MCRLSAVRCGLLVQYEAMPGKARRVIKAREVWKAILDAQTETGTPYMLFKDACNAKSNQQNLGVSWTNQSTIVRMRSDFLPMCLCPCELSVPSWL